MNDELNSRVRADFSKARFKSFINQVISAFSGHPTTLLSYDAVSYTHLTLPTSDLV